jgi:serine/threonine protein kinase
MAGCSDDLRHWLIRAAAGGMGEVYRATDNNLKQSVAIKVLPASVAGDVDRLTRFQREAEVVAALNHTNIAAIYGLEKTRGATTQLPILNRCVRLRR